jgi:hypothetical protein
MIYTIKYSRKGKTIEAFKKINGCQGFGGGENRLNRKRSGFLGH